MIVSLLCQSLLDLRLSPGKHLNFIHCTEYKAGERTAFPRNKGERIDLESVTEAQFCSISADLITRIDPSLVDLEAHEHYQMHSNIGVQVDGTATRNSAKQSTRQVKELHSNGHCCNLR